MTDSTQAPITTIAEVGRHDGQSVTIRGWLYNKRESGKLIFPIFRDGTGVIQGVPEDEPFPIARKEHGPDFLMEHRHLWVRTPRQTSILRIRAEIIRAARNFFDDRGFTLTDPPILTPAACEGTSTLFPVKYFDND